MEVNSRADSVEKEIRKSTKLEVSLKELAYGELINSHRSPAEVKVQGISQCKVEALCPCHQATNHGPRCRQSDERFQDGLISTQIAEVNRV